MGAKRRGGTLVVSGRLAFAQGIQTVRRVVDERTLERDVVLGDDRRVEVVLYHLRHVAGAKGVDIKGKDVIIKSDMNTKIKGGMKVAIEGGVGVDIKGAGKVSVKGAITAIG